jgi:hypothetical protein
MILLSSRDAILGGRGKSFPDFLLHLRIGNDVSMGFTVIRQRLF